jgi:serine/threonine-protein kinase HipA
VTKDGSKFSGAIADTEPDGWGRRVILCDHAKRRERIRAAGGADLPPPNALDFLLAVDDMSCMGALRFKEGDQWQHAAMPFDQRTTPLVIELPKLLSATRAVESQTETEADLAYLRGRGTSLGGLFGEGLLSQFLSPTLMTISKTTVSFIRLANSGDLLRHLM